MLINAQNISKRFANHQALSNLTLQVEQGSIFGLLGPNGAGKTTFIRILNQITYPDTGMVLFNNKPLQPEHINQIGYLPEERGLYKKMKVGEQALYLAQLKGLSPQEAKKKLRHWFEKFEITDWVHKKVEDLSKGMQQKIQFIVTVLHEPKLIILDEPFSGFDPINAQLILNEIKELQQKGCTIIFSTHNMASVEEICDSITLIHKSINILSGKVHDLKNQFKTNLIDITFEGNLIAFTNALFTHFELIKSAQKENTTTATVKLLNNKTINNLLESVIQAVQVKAVNEHLPTMNEIFISQVSSPQIPRNE